jgi:hypothetical protein
MKLLNFRVTRLNIACINKVLVLKNNKEEINYWIVSNGLTSMIFAQTLGSATIMPKESFHPTSLSFLASHIAL